VVKQNKSIFLGKQFHMRFTFYYFQLLKYFPLLMLW